MRREGDREKSKGKISRTNREGEREKKEEKENRRGRRKT